SASELSVASSATGRPGDATASCSPRSCSPACSSALPRTAAVLALATPPSTYVTGTASSLSHTTTFTLTVNAVTPAFDFSLSNGGNKTVVQGQSVTNTITATLVSGSAQSVSFSASGLPSGATASVSPRSWSPACS